MNGKHGQGTHYTKMGADKSAEKIPKNLSAQIVCPSPKVWDFDEKRLHWASVVRARKRNVVHMAKIRNSDKFQDKKICCFHCILHLSLVGNPY